jgi:hypothetical protein
MNYLRSRTLCGVCSIFTLVVLGCRHEDLVMPTTTPTPLVQRGTTLIAVTFRDIGKPTMRAEALVARSVAELNVMRAERTLRGATDRGATFDLIVPKGSDGVFGNATIQLDPFDAATFTVSGQRYFNAMFRVRNAQLTDSAVFDTPRMNLTVVPVSTVTPTTLLDSPVLVWNKLDGTPADPALVRALKPTGLAATEVAGRVVGIDQDVLQVLTEAEVAAVPVPTGVTNIFPYGFMVKLAANPASPRILPASPNVTEFAGVMTVAFRLPVQENPDDDPTTITLMMLALDDSETRITQSLEEQNPAATAAVQTRANAIAATLVRTLPGNPGAFTPATELICSVRTAGPAASPTANLIDFAGTFQSLNPSPYTAAGSAIAPNTTIEATFSQPVQGVGPQTFIARGLQSGQAFRGATFTTAGNTVSTPPGAFLASEEVEVELTRAITCPTPWVGRLRVATRAATGTFTEQPGLPVLPTRPRWIAAGDYNGDHIPDLAVASFVGDAVTILIGNGTGGFTLGQSLVPGNDPISIVTADFNNDGILDLAVANSTSFTVSVFLGVGNGTFGPGTELPIAGSATQIALGDLNVDGHVDLVISNLAPANGVSILMGNGDGTFQPHVDVATGGNPRSVAIGDLNADGVLDLVVVNNMDNNLAALLGHGDGTFGAPALFATGLSPFAVALGDLDRDGRQDVVVANRIANTLSVLRGNGDGTFQAQQTYATGTLPAFVAIGDINGDGILDLAVANSGLPNVGVGILLGVGDGTFNPQQLVPVTTTGPTFVATTDLNADSVLDLVVATGANNGIFSVLIGNP